jgi:hypothetical protein
MKTFITILTIIFFLLPYHSAYSQYIDEQQADKLILEKAKNADRSEFRYIPKKPGHYSAEDWRVVIDSTWGEGLPNERKLQLFDTFWEYIDYWYPSFFNIDDNWDSLRARYRPEIEAGVSRGRFYAIMCRMANDLQDVHTYISDIPVATDTLRPGTPLFVLSGYYSTLLKERLGMDYSHFGAGLSPLPDSSLFVYDAVADHPLGLERGDIIIGYDGIPWKVLYKELLKAELPFAIFPRIGSSQFSITHHLLTAAGENWHLFDTIDIIKYGSVDTLHLSTSLLVDQKMEYLASAQMPISGIPFPDISNGHSISWGLIENDQIGYIYAWNWFVQDAFPGYNASGDEFRAAILEIMNNYNTKGLIIDSRRNSGGKCEEYIKGLEILFNENQDIYREYQRDENNQENHYAMQPTPPEYPPPYIIADFMLYDRPIAVLTGPASWSAGDFMPMQMRYHSMARIFGLPTNGAFGSCWTYDSFSLEEDWSFTQTVSNVCLTSFPGEYLTHLYIPVDEEVWLTQEDAAEGEDTVVKSALQWINNLAYAYDTHLLSEKLYFKPGVDTAIITTHVKNPNQQTLQVSAIIKNQNAVARDTLEMYDDGFNGDSAAADGIYGVKILIDQEQDYRIYIKVKNEEENTSRTLTNAARFTSIGPLSYDGFTPFLIEDSTFNPGDIISFKLYLRNEGETESAKDISVRISSLTHRVNIITSTSDFDSIVAGKTQISQSGLSFMINEDIIEDTLINLPISVYSDGIEYWQTEMPVPVATSIESQNINLPHTYSLKQNYPNPFNPVTMITYQLPMINDVDLSIYNILGQKVATLVNERQQAGRYRVEWDASGFASGVYYYRLEAGEFVDIRKMILLR